MFADYFAGSDLLLWPIVALAIFFSVFVGVLVRIAVGLRKGARLDHVASLPLESESTEARPGRRSEGRG